MFSRSRSTNFFLNRVWTWGLKNAKKDYKLLKHKYYSLKNKLPAVFLDRDGVINKEYSNKHYQNPKQINEGAISAVKKINENGFCL